MQKLLKLSLVALAVSALAACNKEEAKPAAQETTATKQADVNSSSQFKSELDKQAYSIGASFGSYLKNSLDENEKIGVAVDRQLVLSGITDALGGKALIGEEEVNSALQALDQSIRTKREEAAKQKADENIKVGETYIAESLKRDGVKKTDSGLVYEVLTATDGAHPKATDTVKVHYRGTLIDGTEFDSSYSRNEPAVFPLNRVIKGWTEGVQLMTVGSKFKFVIPPDLAYGDRDTGKIPAQSTLVFEVELLSIESPEGDDHAEKKPQGHMH